MKVIFFKQRWQREWQRNIKYLRYVFNDHAVIAFLILLGAGLVGYRELLDRLQVNVWWQVGLVILLAATIMLFRRPATFIEAGDTVVLLADEQRLRDILGKATNYSLLVSALVQVVILVILWPLLLMVYGLNSAALLSVISLVVKIGVTWSIAAQQRNFPRQPRALINWERLSQVEANRQNRILGFFSLFVDVPGVKAPVKRRRYLDWLVKLLMGGQKKVMTQVMARTFVRNSQYLSIWLRLTIVGIVIDFIARGWLQTILLMVMLYLFLLQMMPLLTAYRENVFDHIWPITRNDRIKALQRIVLGPSIIAIILWTELAGEAGQMLHNGIGLLIVLVLMLSWYPKRLLKRATYML